MSLQPPASAPEQDSAVNEILEDIAIVRKHWDPVGDLPIIVMLHELNKMRSRRLRERK